MEKSDPVIAAVNYATLALQQIVRPDALEVDPGPPRYSYYPWPPEWSWEPEETVEQNLRKARNLIDTALAEHIGGYPLDETGYPSQTHVAEWLDHNFPDTTFSMRVLGLAEEVGELCRAVLKREQGIRGTTEQWTQEIRKELGDIWIKLVDVAEHTGFDLATTCMLRWLDIRARDWVADPQGHGIPEDAA